MQYVEIVRAWVVAHPAQAIVYAWMVFNVLWAQLPQPKNPTLARLWNFSHAFLQLVVTNADKPGTFTLPWLIKEAVGVLSSPPTLPPAGPSGPTIPTIPSASTTQTTANQAGEDDDLPRPK